MKLLFFMLDKGTYAADVNSIREVVRKAHTTPLPNAPQFITGIMRLREFMVTLIDTRSLLKGRVISDESKERVLVIDPKLTNKEIYGIIVDRIIGIYDITESGIKWAREEKGALIANEYLIGIISGDTLSTHKEFEKERETHVLYLDVMKMVNDIINWEEGETEIRFIRLFSPYDIPRVK